jgi:hypothetical protein
MTRSEHAVLRAFCRASHRTLAWIRSTSALPPLSKQPVYLKLVSRERTLWDALPDRIKSFLVRP